MQLFCVLIWMEFETIVNTEADLVPFSQKIADLCTDQCCIALHGDLGVGKTTFVKVLGRIWGIEDVKSPSFGIVDVHQGNRTLVHIDAYRLKQGRLSEFDIDDLCRPPFCLIVEWPECLTNAPAFDLHLHFSILPNQARLVRIYDKPIFS